LSEECPIDYPSLNVRLHLAAIAVSLVAIFGIVASGTTQWYLQYPYLDDVLHFVGGFVIAWLIAVLLIKDVRRASLIAALLIIIGGTLLVGVGWEFAEYFSNIWFVDATEGWQATVWRYFHGADLADTLRDLGADTVGALVLSGLILPVARRKRSEE
jgi:uncharacterized membrane protein YjdF